MRRQKICRFETLETRRLLSLVAAYGFNEGAGSAVSDSSGTGNAGTITGATWTSAGKFGSALSFSGSSNFITVNNSTSLELTNGMTLEAWVKPTTISSGWECVMLKERTGGLCYALYAADDANHPPAGYINHANVDNEAIGSTTLALNTWTHLAVTYDNSTIKLYVNGTQAGTKTIAGGITTSTSSLRIGGNSVWGEYFSGLIDEVRIYNTALTKAQIQTDMTTAIASPDATPPTASMTAPANNANVTGNVTVSANASDNVAVAGVQFLLDGQAIGAEDTTSPSSISWNSSTATNGAHTLSARARDTFGNLATSTSINITVSNNNGPDHVGQWSSVIQFPIVDMHMALLKTGKYLMWDGGPDCIGAISATVWDPSTGVFTPTPSETVQEVRDIFCSAPTVLADGRVLVAGGHECVNPNFVGTAIASIFDPTTQQWTVLPDMNYRRWYPTATTLPDGRALVTAGSDTGNLTYDPIPEIYDPVLNTWTKLASASRVIPNYPFMFVLPDGRVFAAGSDEAKMSSSVLNIATQTWTTVDSHVLDAGSAVQYLPGKIMKAGSSYLSDPEDNGGSIPSAATTYTIDMNQPSPAWTQTSSMAFPRTHLNLTILPDDTVLATGGSTDIGGVNPANAVYPAELWSPTTQNWTTMSSMVTPRLYHSTALLMQDGRVLVAGGGHNYFNDIEYPSAEIYSPAYLFKGARPTITSSPSIVSYNSSFFVGTPDGSSIASVSLIKNGAVTHSFNMDQMFVPLNFTQTTGGLTVQSPANSNLATPGYYMLFIVNSNGVPSIAPFVQLPSASMDSQAPTAPANLVGAGHIAKSVALSWNAASDNVGVVMYNVYRSTTGNFIPTTANRIKQINALNFTDTGLPAGTYYYRVTAQDAIGFVSAASNQISVKLIGIAPGPGNTTGGRTPANFGGGNSQINSPADIDAVLNFADGAAQNSPENQAISSLPELPSPNAQLFSTTPVSGLLDEDSAVW